ncbi:MAG: 6-phosphofructokinase [Patescibacteria group bacterium]|nr:6-phosphofructokinase [Patescibacteria group bacterium]
MNNLKGKKLLVFTGGGLAPALNPTLYGVIREAQRQKMKILGGLYGWACLTEKGKSINLTAFNPKPLKDIGGTFLRSSRTNPMCESGGLEVVLDKLKQYKADYVIAIGGDDTLGAANQLFKKSKVKIVGIPKTIDNDLQGTYWSPGFPSAAYHTANFCEEIKIDAAYTLSRVFIIEVLGCQSGWLAASGAYGSADVIIPPEKKVKLKKVLFLIEKKYKENGNFATVVLSEEAKFDKLKAFDQNQCDTFKVKRKNFIALGLMQKVKEELNISCKALFPGNFMQTGSPIKIDATTACSLGHYSVHMLKEDKFGRMARIERTKKPDAIQISDIPLNKAVDEEKVLDKTYFDFEKCQVKKKYLDYMEPILGRFKEKHQSYYKLMQRVVKY